VDSIVSQYSALPMVRRRLLSIQRDQGKKGLVADGRDMGTVVFPDAPVKIFLTASDAVRARRRYLELRARGENVAFDDVLDVIRQRDRIDAERTSAPLKKADDAVEINTDGLTAEEAAREILMHIERRAAESEAHQ
ncbi:MAG: cytidylate kinase, partial [Synergistales bacterium]|nr:cytidylate kinase [Synergistales bacterium]